MTPQARSCNDPVDMSAVAHEPEDVILRDGTTLRLRAPLAADADSLLEFISRLSDRSRYLRFHGFPQLAPKLVEPFVEPDWDERGALIGCFEGRVVALANYARLRDRRAAEVAFTVDDEFQGRGIGTRLLERLVALAADAGIELVDVDFHLRQPGRAWSIVSSIDVSANHLDAARGHLDDVTPVSRGGFEMIERLDTDQLMLAQRRRWEMLRAIADVFAEVDLVLTPTTATTAFVAEGPPPLEIAGQRVGGMGSVPYTAPFNMSGMPAVSIPVGLSVEGLPVGLQVVARRHEEELVLACGAIAEQNRPWPKLSPMAY